MDRETINRGKQLRLVREYRGYSQTDLCKRINGLSQSNLSKFEKGFYGQIKEEKIQEIMEFLNWPIGFLEVRTTVHYA